MKQTLTTLLIFGSILLSGCSNSSYTSGQDQLEALQPTDPLTPYNQLGANDPNYVSNHCAELSGQEHQFYGYMKNKINEPAFESLLESQMNCKSYNGWVKYENGNNVYYQYQKYDGTKNCDWWSKQPAGITVGFFRGYRNTATIAIDATGDGWASSGPGNSQGFPVNRIILNGQIDCTQPDLTIYSATSNGWFSVRVLKENGNKNAQSMRAEVFFNGSSLGKYSLRRSY